MRRRTSLGLLLALAACAAEDSSATSSDATADSADAGGDIGFDAAPDAPDLPSACQPSCPAPAVCDEGGFEPRCECPRGYDDPGGDGRACEDLDECATGAHDCSGGATCVNAPGGFSCDCEVGAIWDGAGCIAVTERRLEAADLHFCEIRNDGTIWCWGNNRVGQLGDGNQGVRSAVPVQAGDANTWLTVAAGGLAGDARTCGLRHDGSLWCWGRNLALAQVDASPVQLVPELGWMTLDVGASHACAVKEEGTLWCWGTNGFGQMGNPAAGNASAVPLQVADETDWVYVATGDAHACGLQDDGTLWCWGINQAGELGDGTTERRNEPVQVGSDTDWALLEAGAVNTCAIKTDGSLYCWGSNTVGQVGSGLQVATQMEPVRIGSDGQWRRIEVGGGYTCGIRSDGSLWCWGNLLGLATTTSLTPRRVGEANDWVEVAIFSMGLTAGGSACGRRQDETVSCWGLNDSGQLGQGTFGDKTEPGRLGSDSWTFVEARSFRTYAIAADGTLWGWGQVQDQEGLYQSAQSSILLDASTDWASLSAGESHQCGQRTDGSLWCWGYDRDGATGLGEEPGFATAPTRVGSDTWQSYDSGGDLRAARTCGIRDDGTLWCWGSGPIGDGTYEDRYLPTQIGTAEDWTAISIGAGVCGLREPGTAWCWGAFGGDQEPVQIGGEAPEDDWMAIEAGLEWAYGIREPGTLWRWDDRTAPTAVGTADDWRSVEELSYITCGLRGSGTLWCWGWDLEGYVEGTGGSLQVPTQVGSAEWTAVSVGGIHICGLQGDDSLWCWGEGLYGRLGTGDAWYDVPTRVP